MVGVDHEGSNFVGGMGEGRIQAEAGAEVDPGAPAFVPALGRGRNDAGAGRCFRKAEISAESMAGRSGCSRQGRACG